MLNPELAEIARYTISEMRGEGWNDDEDIMWCTCGSVLKYAEDRGLVGDDPTTAEVAGIRALVKLR